MSTALERDVAYAREGHLDPLRLATAPIIGYDMGETVYRAGEKATFWYRLVTGAARKYWLAVDGRRHIVDFLRPGDIFGITNRPTCAFAVDAIADGTTCMRYERRVIEDLIISNPQMARWINDAAFDAIARLQEHIVMLGSMSALEKVGSFILDMEGRSRLTSSGLVFLPMSRSDIADYLSIASETVSRTLAELRDRGFISLRGVRCIRICNRSALQKLARNFWGAQK
jgi:CRP-like cAMP-binding protein